MEERVKHLESDNKHNKEDIKCIKTTLDELSKNDIRHDERYLTIIDMVGKQSSSIDKISDKVEKILIAIAKNDTLTGQNTEFKNNFNLKNVLAVALAIIAIITAIGEVIKAIM